MKDYPHSIFELLENEKGVSVIFDWVTDYFFINFDYQLIIFAFVVKDKKAKTSK